MARDRHELVANVLFGTQEEPLGRSNFWGCNVIRRRPARPGFSRGRLAGHAKLVWSCAVQQSYFQPFSFLHLSCVYFLWDLPQRIVLQVRFLPTQAAYAYLVRFFVKLSRFSGPLLLSTFSAVVSLILGLSLVTQNQVTTSRLKSWARSLTTSCT